MGCNNDNPARCYNCSATVGRPKADYTSDAQFLRGADFRSEKITAWRKKKANQKNAETLWRLKYGS